MKSCHADADMSDIRVDFDHVESGDYKDTVYSPSQDTFLFADALLLDLDHITNSDIAVALEIGQGNTSIVSHVCFRCGSGYISAYLLKLLAESCKHNGEQRSEVTTNKARNAVKTSAADNTGSCCANPLPFVLTIDINPSANAATMDTMRRNGVEGNADTATTDMFTSLCKRRSKALVDLVMFNPPYVPSGSNDIAPDDIDKAWNGGFMGREVTDRFITSVGVGDHRSFHTPMQMQDYLSPDGTVYLVR
ncbi:hemk methyltransferase family member 2-like protein [Babesia caballi]|uniref:Hemk methyltransferase family member 2-like protein n=1 Tax=Babesia caballi TaxID=5871 RepID=A0AAV4LWV3_BABCB|nr:hemk methyltransferase family member 2-like protein [Babesia caballi]